MPLHKETNHQTSLLQFGCYNPNVSVAILSCLAAIILEMGSVTPVHKKWAL